MVHQEEQLEQALHATGGAEAAGDGDIGTGGDASVAGDGIWRGL